MANTKEHDKWALPYIDQPPDFWQQMASQYGNHIKEVYFPLSSDIIPSGEPVQPSLYMDEFLRLSPFALSALLNPMVLQRPVEETAPAVIETLRRYIGEYGLYSATITNLNLAFRIREALPELHLTASCLMEISMPNQAAMINDVCDVLVPSHRIVRDLIALRVLKAAFTGQFRLLVNEACLPGCPFRIQHFTEMGSDLPYPRSLCEELLEKQPWLRITGGWVLPQHLHLFDGAYDELKLGGRVTLRNPESYFYVLDAYINRHPLKPHEIGGGPASVLEPIDITEEYYQQTLHCNHQCQSCSICFDYYNAALLP